MENVFIEHELDYMTRYEAIGFTDQYRLVDNQLENIQSKHKYSPKDVSLIKSHCYDGMSNPLDKLLLYVIKTIDGSKGTVLASYGDYGDQAIHQFMNIIPQERLGLCL